MGLFVLHCLDAPGALERRMAARPAHLDYVRAQGSAVRLAGPLTSEDGATILGSLFVLEMDDRAAVDRFVAADPYTAAEVFAQVLVHPFKASVGGLA
jgi:uncharacterized protein